MKDFILVCVSGYKETLTTQSIGKQELWKNEAQQKLTYQNDWLK